MMSVNHTTYVGIDLGQEVLPGGKRGENYLFLHIPASSGGK
jgi:hypothetical protein